MRRNKELRYNLITLLWHVLLVAALYILQACVFPYVPILRTVPLLLPPAVVGIALFEGSVRGGVFGLFAGMLCDVSFNQPTIVFTIALTLIGVVMGILAETVVARGFPSYMVFSLVAVAIIAFLQMFKLLFIDGVLVMAILWTFLLQTLLSLILAFPLYFVIRAVSRRTQRVS